MKSISLNKGFSTLVDDEDYEFLSQFTWFVDGSGYAVASIGFHRVTTRMNRLIMNTPKGLECDHVNGDKLDNRKSNLRNCLVEQNRKNRGRNKNSKYAYKGIAQIGYKWAAKIRIDGKLKHLGLFDTPVEAAKAWDAVARKLHGPFARLNFPD